MYTIENFDLDEALLLNVINSISASLTMEFDRPVNIERNDVDVELTREFLINLTFHVTNPSTNIQYYGKYILPYQSLVSPQQLVSFYETYAQQEPIDAETKQLQSLQTESCNYRSNFKNSVIKLMYENHILTRKYYSFGGQYTKKINDGYLFLSVFDNVMSYGHAKTTVGTTQQFINLLDALEKVDVSSVINLQEFYQMAGMHPLLSLPADEMMIAPSMIPRSLMYANRRCGLILTSHIELLPKRFKHCLVFIYVYNEPTSADIGNFCRKFELNVEEFTTNLRDFGLVLPEWGYLGQ